MVTPVLRTEEGGGGGRRTKEGGHGARRRGHFLLARGCGERVTGWCHAAGGGREREGEWGGVPPDWQRPEAGGHGWCGTAMPCSRSEQLRGRGSPMGARHSGGQRRLNWFEKEIQI
jgi:hypothetical protein